MFVYYLQLSVFSICFDVSFCYSNSWRILVLAVKHHAWYVKLNAYLFWSLQHRFILPSSPTKRFPLHNLLSSIWMLILKNAWSFSPPQPSPPNLCYQHEAKFSHVRFGIRLCWSQIRHWGFLMGWPGTCSTNLQNISGPFSPQVAFVVMTALEAKFNTAGNKPERKIW